MIVTECTLDGSDGSSSSAVARFVSGATVTPRSAPRCLRAPVISSSAGPARRRGRSATGRTTSPTPLAPWTCGTAPVKGARGSVGRADGDRDVGATGEMEQIERVAGACVASVLPLTVPTPTSSTGAQRGGTPARASRRCRCRSRSRRTGRGRGVMCCGALSVRTNSDGRAGGSALRGRGGGFWPAQ